MEPLIVDKRLIGFKEGNCLGYFYSETPETPFSNFYYLQVVVKGEK